MRKPSESSNTRATARYLEGIGLLETFRDTRDWGQLEAAEHQFAEAIQLDPSYEAARFYLGVSHEMVGKHEEAANEFERLLSQVKENERPDFELFYNLGLSYFHQYRRPAYQQAERYLKYLLELTGQPPQEREPEEQVRKRESVRLLGQAVLAQVYSHLSILPVGVSEEQFRPEAERCYSLAMQTARGALAEFQESRDRLDPELARDIGWGLHNAMGHAQLYAFRREGERGIIEESIREFRQALQFDPDNYRVLSNLGSAHFFLAERAQQEEAQFGDQRLVWEENLDSAERYFRGVLQIKPKYDFAFARLAKIALLRGNWHEAKRLVSLARENLSEMTPQYLDNLLGEIEQAQASATAPIS